LNITGVKEKSADGAGAEGQRKINGQEMNYPTAAELRGISSRV